MKTITLSVICLLAGLLSYSQQLLIHEDFNPPSNADSLTNITGWTINDTLFPNTVFFNSKVAPAQTNSFSTGVLPVPSLSNSHLVLTFDHICKIDFLDMARIELTIFDSLNSIDTIVYRLPVQTYFGTGSYVSNGGGFGCASYGALWMPSVASAIPQISWWRHETFLLNYGNTLFANAQYFSLRFVLSDAGTVGAMGNFGWLIDNFDLSNVNTVTISAIADPEIMFYPNPTKDYLYFGSLYKTARIYNSFGGLYKEVLNTDRINLSTAKAGIYFVELNGSNSVKVVKE